MITRDISQTNQKSSGPLQVSISRALELGMRHHTGGDLSKAESIYQQILQAEPNHPFALHLLGVVSHQVGKIDIA